VYRRRGKIYIPGRRSTATFRYSRYSFSFLHYFLSSPSSADDMFSFILITSRRRQEKMRCVQSPVCRVQRKMFAQYAWQAIPQAAIPSHALAAAGHGSFSSSTVACCTAHRQAHCTHAALTSLHRASHRMVALSECRLQSLRLAAFCRPTASQWPP